MNRKINILMLVSLLAVACSKQLPGQSGAVETPVHIEAGLLSNKMGTKGPITDTNFPDAAASTTSAGAATYGIFVCENGTLDTPHKSNSWNLRAAHYPDDDPSTPDWRYTYVGNLSTGALASGDYDDLSITSHPEGKTADLYAYAPYIQDAYRNTPQAIPFTMNGSMVSQIDLMYAVENLTNANSALDPRESSLNATFTFRHAFTLLEFKFKLRVNGTFTSLNRINVSLNDPDDDGITSGKIYTSGTFNAVTGTFNSCNAVNSYSVTYPNSYATGATDINSATIEASAYLMLVPTQPENDELVFRFTIGGLTLQPFYLKKSQLLHSDGITYGFQSGFTYTFHFTLDNYLYLDGIDIEDGWGSVSQGPFVI